MWKRVRRGLEKWGHYLLALLCAGVVLLSAAWTRDQRAAEKENQLALADQSQRLSQARETTEEFVLLRPCDGAVLFDYSEKPVYFAESGVWMVHPAVTFAVQEDEPVRAMAAGTVSIGEDDLQIDHGENGVSQYRGIGSIAVQDGQQVKAGQVIGHGGGRVPFEGKQAVRVTLAREGQPVPFGETWVDKTGK